MILSDADLKKCLASGSIRIDPFDESALKENGIDLRLGYEVMELELSNQPLDIGKEENLTRRYYKREITQAQGFVVPPNGRVLVTTLEYIEVPNDLMMFCQLRSTFARLGLSIPPTIADAGFRGQLTIELVGSSFPIRLYPEVPFLHAVFCRLTSPVQNPYRGVYQGQRGVTLPKMWERLRVG